VDEVVVRRLTPDDWAVLRDVRLRALADSPDAFGSTLERERDFEEKDWRRRSVRPVLVVEVDGRPVAMAGTFPEGGVLQVWGMWTDPAFRGRGIGRRILADLVAWAQGAGRTPYLHVTEGNDGARALYVACGFVPTGRWDPLREGSSLRIEELVLRRG
jgi:predicted GNAT family acetyltransferase